MTGNRSTDKPTADAFSLPGGWIVRRDPAREEQSRRLWEMTAAERGAAMRAGRLTSDQLSEWARRRPDEVPLLNGEFWFIAITTPEVAEAD